MHLLAVALLLTCSLLGSGANDASSPEPMLAGLNDQNLATMAPNDNDRAAEADGNAMSKMTMDEAIFRCDDNSTVTDDRICNGMKDCPNGDDETDDTCLTRDKCPNGRVKCQFEHRCVDSLTLCSNDSSAWTCLPDWVRCGNTSVCIQKSKLCNFRKDCVDGFDEDSRSCPPGTRRCPADFPFRCFKQNGDDMTVPFYSQCQADDLLCNGMEDCPGGEDETAPGTECSKTDRYAAAARVGHVHQPDMTTKKVSPEVHINNEREMTTMVHGRSDIARNSATLVTVIITLPAAIAIILSILYVD